MRLNGFVALLAIAAMLVLAPGALADNSSVLSGYGGSGAKPVVVVKGETTSGQPPASAAAGGTLPFTGSDLGVMVAAGVALAGLGLGMRRLARDKK